MKQTLVGMNSHFRAFLREESGQDLIEYALVAALIAFGSVAAMQTLAANIATGFSNVGTKMTTYEVDPIGWTKKRPSLDGVAAG